MKHYLVKVHESIVRQQRDDLMETEKDALGRDVREVELWVVGKPSAQHR